MENWMLMDRHGAAEKNSLNGQWYALFIVLDHQSDPPLAAMDSRMRSSHGFLEGSRK